QVAAPPRALPQSGLRSRRSSRPENPKSVPCWRRCLERSRARSCGINPGPRSSAQASVPMLPRGVGDDSLGLELIHFHVAASNRKGPTPRHNAGIDGQPELLPECLSLHRARNLLSYLPRQLSKKVLKIHSVPETSQEMHVIRVDAIAVEPDT